MRGDGCYGKVRAAIAAAGRFIDGSCPLISGQLRYVSD
jgi:hypothetical protein